MSSRRVWMAAALGLVHALLVPAAAMGQARGIDTIFQRPVDIRLRILNSKQYGGDYAASGISRYCGNVQVNMTGNTKQMGVEFPDGGQYEIEDLTFSADTLTSGTTTTKYHLVLHLKTKDGGRPPAWVLRTYEPRFRETGTASFTVVGGTARFSIDGQNADNERVELNIFCKPRIN